MGECILRRVYKPKVVITDTYLFNEGNQNTSLTGGWFFSGLSGMTASFGNVMRIYPSTENNTREGYILTHKTVDVTNYKTLEFKISVASNRYGVLAGCTTNDIATTANGTSSFVATASVAAQSTGSKTLKVDVSGVTGKYYISLFANDADVTVSSVMLKV